MANPDKSLPRERLSIGKQVQPPKQPMPLGADIAVVLPRAWGEPLTLSHWDVWFARVASKDFGGDLNRLAGNPPNESNAICGACRDV